VPPYLGAQFSGAIGGVLLAHLMFELPVVTLSARARSGAAQMLSEAVATFGLLLIIGRCAGTKAPVPIVVGAYITAAYWFTASTSFANPAVTIARALSDTFAGIRPSDVPGFIGAQLAGAGAAIALLRWFGAAEPAAGKGRIDEQAERAVSLHR
jgi:glycerol uptake facilitator-like aquaporin